MDIQNLFTCRCEYNIRFVLRLSGSVDEKKKQNQIEEKYIFPNPSATYQQ